MKITSGPIHIAGRTVGEGSPPYVVAEMSGNHNRKIERAFEIFDQAKKAGADAVKIQTYRPDTITIDHSAPEFFVDGGLWGGRRLYDLYEEAHTPWDWHRPLFDYARKIGLTLFSSPFDFTAVDLLESLGTPAYKIASPELIDLALIRRVGATGKPVILSTGMATLEEIEEAIDAARSAGAGGVVVLHCTSSYPTQPEDANLSTIQDIKKRFGVVAGLSDHTEGHLVSALAVSLGADMIEKHFTLSRADGGVDSAFSLEPQELSGLVQAVSVAHKSVGTHAYTPVDAEKSVLRNRRSLYVVEPVRVGEQFTEKNIRSIRPGNGLKPKFIDQVLGKTATRDISFGEPLDATMVSGGISQ